MWQNFVLLTDKRVKERERQSGSGGGSGIPVFSGGNKRLLSDERLNMCAAKKSSEQWSKTGEAEEVAYRAWKKVKYRSKQLTEPWWLSGLMCQSIIKYCSRLRVQIWAHPF